MFNPAQEMSSIAFDKILGGALNAVVSAQNTSALTPQLKKSVGGYARGAEWYLLALQEFADGQRLYTLSSEIAAEVQKLLVFDGKEARGSAGKARDALRCLARFKDEQATEARSVLFNVFHE